MYVRTLQHKATNKFAVVGTAKHIFDWFWCKKNRRVFNL